MIIFAWVFVTSFIVLKILDSAVGIRASEEYEEIGLNKAEIGVEAYPDEEIGLDKAEIGV